MNIGSTKIIHGTPKIYLHQNSFQNNLRSSTQSHTRRIHDLQAQFDEARGRIDKLLSRKSVGRTGSFDRRSSGTTLSPKISRASVGETAAPSESTTKVEITMEPRVQAPTFAPVSLTVNINEEDDEQIDLVCNQPANLC